MTLVENPRFFSYFCDLVSVIGIIPLKFAPRARQVRLINKPSKITKWSHRISTIMVVALFGQWVLQCDKLSLDGAVAGIGLLALCASRMQVHQENCRMHEIAQFCNGLFQFDEMFPCVGNESWTPLKIKINKMMVYCAAITAVALPPGFAYALHWNNPCKSSLVGYWFIPECHGIHMPQVIGCLVKCFVIFLNHWMWSFNMHGAVFAVAVLTTLSVSSIHQFIQRFGSKVIAKIIFLEKCPFNYFFKSISDFSINTKLRSQVGSKLCLYTDTSSC